MSYSTLIKKAREVTRLGDGTHDVILSVVKVGKTKTDKPQLSLMFTQDNQIAWLNQIIPTTSEDPSAWAFVKLIDAFGYDDSDFERHNDDLVAVFSDSKGDEFTIEIETVKTERGELQNVWVLAQ